MTVAVTALKPRTGTDDFRGVQASVGPEGLKHCMNSIFK